MRLFRETKQHDRLVEVCERAVSVQSKDLALLYTLGDAYLRAGQPEQSKPPSSRGAAAEPTLTGA